MNIANMFNKKNEIMFKQSNYQLKRANQLKSYV